MNIILRLNKRYSRLNDYRETNYQSCEYGPVRRQQALKQETQELPISCVFPRRKCMTLLIVA